MRTIHIDVKDSYLNNVLGMLESLKGVMLNKIDIDAPKSDHDKTDFTIIQNAQIDSMKNTWENESDKAWDEI